jgi:arylformamidase
LAAKNGRQSQSAVSHRFQTGTYQLDYDRAYANGPFIPGAETFPPRWAREAAAFRASLGQRARTGVPYGPGPRNALDLFLPDAAPQGLLVFVHGGYWLRFNRDLWSHLAAGAVTRGWACAMPSYTLAPEARISAMTAEIARAVEVAAGLVAGPVVVTGHSAGGHLSARMGCADVTLSAPVRRVVPISPLADLEPISLTAMNADLRLDAPEIARESPALLALRPGVEAHVWVGAQERPAFLWQARLLSEAWSCPWTPESGKHHFDIVEGLTDPASALLSVCLG